ncbi:MAG: topoisomerase DNA-binding C4 zinc finger domain-containing protein, partial [Actinobacteria bacterium]|nr:topoisomerase DNA-binding C4 zinc finger domain-containing protein [Actinomycetota bacterium]
RPSTYAPTISTIQDRGYVERVDKRLKATEIGTIVNDLLVKHFPEIVDVGFTARMEDELDDIAEGKLRWVEVLDGFYGPFERLLEKKEGEIERPEEELDELCPKCPEEGREPGRLVIKLGRRGKFVGCRNWPECDYTRDVDGQARPEPEVLDEMCPECGRPLTRRHGRYGPFVGCSGYPECRYIKKEQKSTGVACPKCGEGELLVRRSRKGKVFYGCSRYPSCDFTVWQRPLPEPCRSCGSLVTAQGRGKGKCTSCGTVVEIEEPAAQGAGG